MTIKPLLRHEKRAIQEQKQWERKRESIQSNLFDIIGIPPIERNTRSFQIINEEVCDQYIRFKVSYIVGEGDVVTAYLLRPKDLHVPVPAILALHQTVEFGKDEVVGLRGNPDFAYGHELAMRGFIVLAPDQLTAGERIYPGKNCFDSGFFIFSSCRINNLI